MIERSRTRQHTAVFGEAVHRLAARKRDGDHSPCRVAAVVELDVAIAVPQGCRLVPGAVEVVGDAGHGVGASIVGCDPRNKQVSGGHRIQERDLGLGGRCGRLDESWPNRRRVHGSGCNDQ